MCSYRRDVITEETRRGMLAHASRVVYSERRNMKKGGGKFGEGVEVG